jgi:cystathionine beta-lyase/cystathionine gamma-synthase
VETVLAALEGAEAARLAGSGIGAISVAVLSLVEQGTHLVAQTNHYGGTLSLLRDLLPLWRAGDSRGSARHGRLRKVEV